MKRIYHCGCELDYKIINESTFIFNIAVANSKSQNIICENLSLTPQLNSETIVFTPLGNRYLKINVPPGEFKLKYQTQVEVIYADTNPDDIIEVMPRDLPIDILQYINPSRYCESDRLFRFAQSEFGSLESGYSKVTMICNWIYDHVTYLSGSTDSQTSAFNTVTERAGVCRDFAHLGVALCRALGIPARFATGYAYHLIPPDFHAFFEAYLGGRWYIFDATRLVPLEGLIRIGTGRDAADVAFATIFGGVEMTQIQINVDTFDANKPLPTTRAIYYSN